MSYTLGLEGSGGAASHVSLAVRFDERMALASTDLASEPRGD